MTPKVSRRDLERENAALRADLKELDGRLRVVLGGLVYMMHLQGRTVIDVTVPEWVWGQDISVGSAFDEATGAVVVTRDRYLKEPGEEG